MIETLREALAGERAWLVGGALRDRLLGRPTPDLDVVVDGDVRRAARSLGRGAGGASFELSDQFGAWRVVARDRSWQVDITPLQGGSLEADLGARDLTVNAMAEPLAGGELVDPHGGARDLDHKRLRMVSAEAFVADPLRTLRVARLATELGFEIDPDTAAAVRRHAPGLADTAQERVFTELRRIVGADAAVRGLALMDELELVAAVLPELDDAARGRAEPLPPPRRARPHPRGPAGHASTSSAIPRPRSATSRWPRRSARCWPSRWPTSSPAAAALRFGALLHDIAKPQTRAELPDGRIGFPRHDEQGAEMARAALARLRASERLRSHVAALTRHHLRLGFLVHQMPLDRHELYRYLLKTEPVEADVTLLSVADRLATRGRKADEAIAKHLELARVVLAEALARRAAGPQPPLVRGDELAAELGIARGPELGELMSHIAEARFAGEVSTRDEALALARAARDAR